MENLKQKASHLDLKISFLGSNQKIHYQEITKEMFPELFEEVTTAVEKALNKQMQETNQFLKDYYLDHNKNEEMTIEEI